METIVYYCKYYGVTPKSLPRDIFSSNTFENGIVYSIGFHAQFFEDMEDDDYVIPVSNQIMTGCFVNAEWASNGCKEDE